MAVLTIPARLQDMSDTMQTDSVLFPTRCRRGGGCVVESNRCGRIAMQPMNLERTRQFVLYGNSWFIVEFRGKTPSGSPGVVPDMSLR